MRRTGLLIAGWAVATLLALVLGLQGVSAISGSVSDHRKASLSPESVRAALDRASMSASSSSASSLSESAASASLASAGSIASSGDLGAPQPQSASEGEQPASSDDGQGSSGATAVPEDRTYQLIGGNVGVRFENGEAHLLWATPNAGYSVESKGDSSSVDLRFNNGNHESRLKAFWNGGPQQEIEEGD